MHELRSSFSRPVRTLLVACLALTLSGLGATAPAIAGQGGYLMVGATGSSRSQAVTVGLNKSMIIDLPVDVHEVIVSQPQVANAIVRSKRRAIIQGIGSGDTNIIFLDGGGRTISVLDIKVTKGPSEVGSALQGALARALPGSRIAVESVSIDEATNRVVLTGSVLSEDDRARALAIATQFAGGPDNVASILDVAGPQQVMLKVTVAEVQREAVRQLGINLSASYATGGFATGLINSPGLGGASGVIAPNSISAGVDIGGLSIDATLRALERRSALRTLAEPTLTAMSGQEANFLAGGEFPVPTEVDENGRVSYTFKKFGVELTFTPTVKSNGIIGLVVNSRVSELSSEGGFSAGGVTIPATKERQAKTTVELGAGQTLAIGGLIEDRVRQQISQFPGLGNIPILGALFRSRDFIHTQTELVILVTPYLAHPTNNAPVLPTDRLVFAGDAEAIFLGHIEKTYGVGEPNAMRRGYDGSVGFVLD